MLNFKEFMNTMNITQSRYTNYTHKGVNAYDLAGKDSGIESLFVPSGQKIKCIGFRQDGSNTNYSFYEFQNPVKLKNGKTINKLQMMCLHGYGTDKVGKIYTTGQAFYDEGTMGNAQGNHVHIEFGTGYNNKNYFLKKNKYGNYVANFTATINIEDIFFTPDNLYILNNQGINFSKTDIKKKKNLTFEVWGIDKNQYGVPLYFYSEKKENGKVTRKQAKKTNGYAPSGYTELEILQTTNLNSDSNLNHIYKNKDGSNKQLKKGDTIVVKYIKTIKK